MTGLIGLSTESIVNLLIGLVIGAVLVGTIAFVLNVKGRRKAEKLLIEAKKEADKHRRDTLLELKEESYKLKSETEKEINLSFINILSFAFLVSLDSLTLGLGLNYITNNIFLASTIFMTLSSTFTYLGFTLGKCITKNIGKYRSIIR